MQDDPYEWISKPELVRDVINGICHQRYEKHLGQQKHYPSFNAAEENLEDQVLHNKISILIIISTHLITTICLFVK